MTSVFCPFLNPYKKNQIIQTSLKFRCEVNTTRGHDRFKKHWRNQMGTKRLTKTTIDHNRRRAKGENRQPSESTEEEQRADRRVDGIFLPDKPRTFKVSKEDCY
ncbi:hypothetical protein AVEN_256568-1 [Araneus ventricosus]|uniref:Uncharacterized protein n=1 Tax=Araneus ventricosus TaxID=182803 RepID=A0A4Y2R5Y2_ARAVE|nr:hypothetical protein AVEN_256568-1 [Araneus ventricosus]